MAEQTTLTPFGDRVVPKTKGTRGPRRNYVAELTEIESYCRAAIDLLDADDPGANELRKGQAMAYNKILSKIGGSRRK